MWSPWVMKHYGGNEKLNIPTEKNKKIFKNSMDNRNGILNKKFIIFFIYDNNKNKEEKIRTEIIEKYADDLKQSEIKNSPEFHIQYLENEGLNFSEIQETLNRLKYFFFYLNKNI